MAGSSSSPSGGRLDSAPRSIWRRIPSSPDSASPGSAAPAPRRSDERPVVSGLGLSASSSESGSPGVDSGLDGRREVQEQGVEEVPWERPRPSKKTLWRARVENRGQVGPPSFWQVAPEMEGLCFKCYRPGHHKKKCTNDPLCFRCGKDGHEAKECKRPRSPPSEDELRRVALANFARQVPQGIRDPRHPRRQAIVRQEQGQVPPPPPPPPPPVAWDSSWPGLSRSPSPAAPAAQRRRLSSSDDVSELVWADAPLCVVRRSRSMVDLEARLRHAVVAYVGGDRPAVSCEQVHDALEEKLGIGRNCCSVHPFQPEEFLIVLPSEDLRRRVTARPLEHGGFSLHTRPWTRLGQATQLKVRKKVQLVMEGIPPHAWERAVAEELLGTSCVVEELAPDTRARRDLALFRLSAWTEDTEAIPPARLLVIPEPEEVDVASAELARLHREEVSTLRYKVLIHVDSVEEDLDAAVLSSFGEASDGGRGNGAHGGGRSRRSVPWQRGIPDRRGGGGGGNPGAGEGRRTYRQVAVASLDWKLPPMEGQDGGQGATSAVAPLTGLSPTTRSSNLAAGAKAAAAAATSQESATLVTEKRGAPNPERQKKVWVRRPSQQRPLEVVAEEILETSPTPSTEVGGANPHTQSKEPTETSQDVSPTEKEGTGDSDESEPVLVEERVGQYGQHDYFAVSLSETDPEVEQAHAEVHEEDLDQVGRGELGPVSGARTESAVGDAGQIVGPGLNPPADEAQQTSAHAHTQELAVNTGDQELMAMSKIRAFCARILKALAPPLLKEVETANKLNAQAEPFTPRRVTRRSATATPARADKPFKKATTAETVLLKALGITPTELSVNDDDLLAFQNLFDSPLREQHLRVVASIFGKIMPPAGHRLDHGLAMMEAH
ncbi:hypothetical protein QYE76_007072 [Lolium multiflorum]|uniref:CCHC-type domain-containing protein n=1 Tax=Lolium multiflorum TaxID=4521 RepID=A0AAD8RXR9_LOLMU|nr:hypothetical protein QYE76_007072 [Lolium multiflorum]